MANPQCEDGYTKIANEIMEALSKINMSPYEWRVLLFVIRRTYGWQKKRDLIPLSQIVLGTGISKGHVCRTLKSLILKQIVTRTGNKQIGFNKNYVQWLPVQVTHKKLPAEVTSVTSRGNKKLPAEEPQKKRKKYKEKKYKEKKDITTDFLEYAESLKGRFPLIDFDHEFEACLLYWEVRPHKDPKRCLLNWMTKAEKFRTEYSGEVEYEQLR